MLCPLCARIQGPGSHSCFGVYLGLSLVSSNQKTRPKASGHLEVFLKSSWSHLVTLVCCLIKPNSSNSFQKQFALCRAGSPCSPKEEQCSRLCSLWYTTLWSVVCIEFSKSMMLGSVTTSWYITFATIPSETLKCNCWKWGMHVCVVMISTSTGLSTGSKKNRALIPQLKWLEAKCGRGELCWLRLIGAGIDPPKPKLRFSTVDWSDSRKGSLEIIRNTLGHLGSAFWTAFNLSLGTQTVENCGNSINPRISRAKRSSFPNSAPMGRYADRDAISKAGDWVNWVPWRNMTTVVPRILRLGVWRVCISVLSTKILNYNGTWQYKSYFLLSNMQIIRSRQWSGKSPISIH